MSFQSNYALAPLGEVARFINGDRSTNYPKGDDYVDDGTPFISATELREGRIDYSGVRRISSRSFERLRSGKIQRDDVLFCLRGSIGKIAYVNDNEDGAIASSLVIVRATEKIDSRYLFFGLSSRAGQQAAMGLNNGAAQPNLSVGELQRIPLPLPPLPIQRRIAGILSAYDELIENNQRRIKILESMARALYREWFVHFRFPGHESVPLVPSPLGEIPQGWEGSFGGLATIERDGINPFEFPEEEFEHFSLPAFDNGRQPAIEQGAAILSGKYVIDDSTVLLSKLNPRIPRIWLPAPSGRRRAITSTEFIGLKPNSGVTREFIYAKCCSDEFAGQFGSLAIGTSTSHQRVKPENLLAMPSTVPEPSTIARFTKVVSPMLTVSQQLRSQIQTLRRTRDLLLPRLLSGQIDV